MCHQKGIVYTWWRDEERKLPDDRVNGGPAQKRPTTITWPSSQRDNYYTDSNRYGGWITSKTGLKSFSCLEQNRLTVHRVLCDGTWYLPWAAVRVTIPTDLQGLRDWRDGLSNTEGRKLTWSSVQCDVMLLQIVGGWRVPYPVPRPKCNMIHGAIMCVCVWVCVRVRVCGCI